MALDAEKEIKRYYSITEVSELFQQPASKLRYWETVFSDLKPKTNNRGVRLYTQKDIDLIKLIVYYVVEQKMTLSGAAKLIKEKPGTATKTTSVAERLANIRSQLEELQKALDAISPNGQPF